jgi:hypothetical protein
VEARCFSDSFSRLLELSKGGVSVDMSIAKLDQPAVSVEGIKSGGTLGTPHIISLREGLRTISLRLTVAQRCAIRLGDALLTDSVDPRPHPEIGDAASPGRRHEEEM